jgi:glycine/D-amino acid oxidase-like deaminating enzyme
MDGVPDGFEAIVSAALRGRVGRRLILVWEGDGAERFFERWVGAGRCGRGEVWIFHVTGCVNASGPHVMNQVAAGGRLIRVQRHPGWEPSDLMLSADVYAVASNAPSAKGDDYPVSRIARVISSGGVLIGPSTDAGWMLAAERAGFVGNAGVILGEGVWARSFVGRSRESKWGGVGGGRVAVIGAGLAGSAVADGLASRGVEVEVFDGSGVGREASGNRAAVMVPMVAMDDGLPARLSRWGFGKVRGELEGDGVGVVCGVLQLSTNERVRRVCEAGLGGEGFRVVGRGEAAELCGVRGVDGGLWFAEAGWVNPARLCAARFSRHRGAVSFRAERVAGFERIDGLYALRGLGGSPLGGGYAAIVLATAGVPDWVPWEGRGVGTKLAWGRNVTLETESFSGLRAVVTGAGYCIPVAEGRVHLGATYEFEAVEAMDDTAAVGSIWQKSVGFSQVDFPVGPWEVRRAVRVLTADRLPMMGGAGGCDGIFVACGLGSRGVVWSGVGAELIPSLVVAEPPMVPRSWIESLDPSRFSRNNGRGRGG